MGLAAALLAPGRRPRRAEGLFKWLGSAAEAGAILNDGWYLGTLRLVRAPAAAEVPEPPKDEKEDEKEEETRERGTGR